MGLIMQQTSRSKNENKEASSILSFEISSVSAQGL